MVKNKLPSPYLGVKGFDGGPRKQTRLLILQTLRYSIFSLPKMAHSQENEMQVEPKPVAKASLFITYVFVGLFSGYLGWAVNFLKTSGGREMTQYSSDLAVFILMFYVPICLIAYFSYPAESRLEVFKKSVPFVALGLFTALCTPWLTLALLAGAFIFGQ
jgi:hypothetical protein